MATRTNKSGLPGFFADPQSSESLRRQFIEAPFEAAHTSVLGSLIEVASILSAVPGAYVEAQTRELERVKNSGRDDDDDRVKALQASIDRANAIRTTASRGQARAQRVVMSVGDRDYVFHGFVSDADFAPLKGLTVRLTATDSTKTTKPLTSTTEDDGYFRIPLKPKPRDRKGSSAPARSSLLERITSFSSSFGAQAHDAGSADQQDTAMVEVLQKGKLIYRDPTLVALGQGNVYREYVISSDRQTSASDLRDFVSRQKIVLDSTDSDNASGP